MSNDYEDLSFVSLLEFEFDGLCVVFDGARQKYLAGSS